MLTKYIIILKLLLGYMTNKVKKVEGLIPQNLQNCIDTFVNIVSDAILTKVNESLLQDSSRKSSVTDDESYLTRKEVMNLLKVTEPTLWRWEKDEKLLPVRFSARAVRYRFSDVLKMVDSNE